METSSAGVGLTAGALVRPTDELSVVPDRSVQPDSSATTARAQLIALIVC
jgi:hypothetical protein